MNAPTTTTAIPAVVQLTTAASTLRVRFVQSRTAHAHLLGTCQALLTVIATGERAAPRPFARGALYALSGARRGTALPHPAAEAGAAWLRQAMQRDALEAEVLLRLFARARSEQAQAQAYARELAHLHRCLLSHLAEEALARGVDRGAFAFGALERLQHPGTTRAVPRGVAPAYQQGWAYMAASVCPHLI